MCAAGERHRVPFGPIGSTLPTPWLVGQAVVLSIRMTRDLPDPKANRASSRTLRSDSGNEMD